MLPSKKASRRQVAEINVVPYVDVMLVLLVIFMATAPIIMQGVQVDLPKTQAKQLDNKKDSLPVIISVDDKGNLYLNISTNPLNPIDHKQLQMEVAAAILREPTRLVTVKADHRVSYNTVLHAMVLLQASGVASVSLETEGINNTQDGK